MLFENINLFPNDKDTYLRSYICQKIYDGRKKAVLVIPGGGYSCVCDAHEGDTVARTFLAEGYNVFVLKYSVGADAKDSKPLIQAAAAMKYIRDHAPKYNVDPDYIFVCGFSAGGHLSGWLGTSWGSETVKNALGIDDASVCRPTGMILSYPVITAGKFTHKGSIDNLCGDSDAPQEVRDRFALEKFVDKDTSPAFIWANYPDTCVPIENSLAMADALRKNGVPFDFHIFSDGWHGMSVATPEVDDGDHADLFRRVHTWIPLCLAWLETVKPFRK